MVTMLATMKTDTHSGRAIAMAARINAAVIDAAAVRACVEPMARQLVAQRLRAERLAARLARIESYARRAMARTRDEQARTALGDVVVTASERDAPTLLG